MIIKIKQLLTVGMAAFTLFSFSSLAVAPNVSANGLFNSATNEACKGAQLTDSGKCDGSQAGRVETLVKRLLNILSVIIGIVAVIMIIINGLRFITSGGDSNAVGNAKRGIIYAIVGLVVVALAQFIVLFVLNTTNNAINNTPSSLNPQSSHLGQIGSIAGKTTAHVTPAMPLGVE